MTEAALTQTILYYLSWACLGSGSFFYIVGSIGLLRMPDVFTRMHATSVSDTFGAFLMLIGMLLQAGLSLVSLKLIVIIAIILYTGPVATHALARAARHAGIEPMLDHDLNEDAEDTPSK
ncbi:MAG TPA: sodium:proton antiporter [Rhizobiales bacterium]|nr:sodium:proton antiporter [Hyphomicrobiales bacterium]